MHKISIKYLKPGMIVGKSIYNARGNFLLNKGTLLTPKYIQRLNALNVPAVYIIPRNMELEFTPPDDIIQEKTRMHATKNIYSVFHHCQLTNSLKITTLKKAAATIVQDLISNKDTLVQISDIRTYDDYTFSHSVNVAVLSSMLGVLCNFTKKYLTDLTLGALLHDIGKTKVPLHILNKPRALTQEEKEIIQRHPEYGYRILARANLGSSVPMQIARQHHEKYDGSGYPQQLSGAKIHKFARIVAIADVYDALTADRPYKRPYKPNLAYKLMTGCNSHHFDRKLLKLFFDHIAIYPVGSILKLNTGAYGIVVDVKSGQTQTPSICIFADKEQTPLASPYFLNWKSADTDPIESVLEEYELLALLEKIDIHLIQVAVKKGDDSPHS